MRKGLIFFFLSSFFLFAQEVANSVVVEPMRISLLWLIISLLIVGLFFWAIYKLMTTKNPKYGYVLLLAGVLMLASVFI
jgi:vacuolar-type H+-ATPase subunit I/STV1